MAEPLNYSLASISTELSNWQNRVIKFLDGLVKYNETPYCSTDFEVFQGAAKELLEERCSIMERAINEVAHAAFKE